MVNLKHVEGFEIVQCLMHTMDVLIENYVSGKLAMIGLSWKDCHALDRQFIYASITGAWALPCIADRQPSCWLWTDRPISGGTQVWHHHHQGGGRPHAHVTHSLCCCCCSSWALADWQPHTTHATGEPNLMDHCAKSVSWQQISQQTPCNHNTVHMCHSCWYCT